jgi:hypothetical protein
MQKIKSMSNFLCIIIKLGTKGRMQNFILHVKIKNLKN